MFNFSLGPKNHYTWNFSINDNWLTHQLLKAKERQSKTLIIADLFCETVYDVVFPKKEVQNFCREVSMKTIKVGAELRCITETEIVEQLWSKSEYIACYRYFLLSNISDSELVKQQEIRATMYNSSAALFNRMTLKRYAKRAIALFKTEQKLEEIVNSRQITKIIL
jgi:hypothetical protein